MYNTFVMTERQDKSSAVIAEKAMIEEIGTLGNSPQKRAIFLKAFGRFRQQVIDLDHVEGLVVGFNRKEETINVVHLLKDPEPNPEERIFEETFKAMFTNADPFDRDLLLISTAYAKLAPAFRGSTVKVFVFTAPLDINLEVAYTKNVRDSSHPMLFISKSNTPRLLSAAA